MLGRRPVEVGLEALEAARSVARNDATLERGELVAEVARLPRRLREVVVLRFWIDLSVTETAAALGTSEGAVKAYTARGLARLRDRLREAQAADGARVMGYIRTALNTVVRTDPACRFGVGLRAGATSVSQGAPSARMLALLAVLRRPATAADRLPRTRFYIKGRLNLFLPVGEVYVRYIRLARVADGIAFYLIPVGKDGPPAPARATLDRCYAQQIATLRGKLTGVPVSLRASTMRDGERFFAESRTNVANRRVHESVYELEAAQNGGGASDAGSAAAIQRGGPLGGLGPQSTQKTVIMSGVVPDGVATVTLHYAAGGSGAHHLPPLTVTSTVVGNVFAMAIPDFGATRNWPSTMVWRSRTGVLIKTIDERPLSP